MSTNRRSIDKSKGQKPRLVAVEGKRVDDEARGHRLKLRRLDSFEERDIDWLWYPYLARGELTIVEGDPGSHKSRMMHKAIADLIDDWELPSRFPNRQGDVDCAVIFDCENDGETSLRRRFRCVGLKRTEAVHIASDPFQMSLDTVDDIIDQLRDLEPDIIVFDTMNDYFERWVDTHKGRDVVQGLQPFKRMAKELDASVVLIRHLRKSPGKALYAGQGSISYVGKARFVITVAKSEEESTEDADLVRMALTKVNEARAVKALEFTVKDLSTPQKDGEFRIKWGGYVNMSADDLLNAPRERGRPSRERDFAEEVLRDILKKGPVESNRVFALAEAKSITERTLRRAAESLGVIKRQEGHKWYWELRPDGQK